MNNPARFAGEQREGMVSMTERVNMLTFAYLESAIKDTAMASGFLKPNQTSKKDASKYIASAISNLTAANKLLEED